MAMVMPTNLITLTRDVMLSVSKFMWSLTLVTGDVVGITPLLQMVEVALDGTKIRSSVVDTDANANGVVWYSLGQRFLISDTSTQ